MKKNAIISLAMLYALWQTKRSDLLDLIRPFVLYAVGVTTKVGDIIDVEGICRYMESEFGYQSFQCAVVERILLRETSDAIKQESRIIKKENRKFILIASLSTQVENFNSKRLVCKEHSDAVTTALAGYLNHNRACRRDNYTSSEAEVFLLSFFERQGGSIVLSADDLRQISFKNSELDFFIGKFILEENEKRSSLMDYIVELVKGYFVTTALYLQAENLDVTHASFSNVIFYLDTRLLLALLGFKSSQENESVQEMVKSLQRNGAKLACFSYNIEEVENPMIVCGVGAVVSDACEEVKELAVLLDAPVGTAAMGQGIIGGNDPYYAGRVGGWGNKCANELCWRSDVVITLGNRFDEDETGAWEMGDTYNMDKTKIIHVHTDPRELGRVYPIEVGIHGDPKSVLQELIELIKAENRTFDHNVKADVAKGRAEYFAEMAEYRNSDSYPINPFRFVKELEEVFPKNGVQVGAAICARNYYCHDEPRSAYYGYGMDLIGTSLAQALGFAVGCPDRKVVSVEGDGGFLIHSSMLATAAEYHLPITWIVVNNSSYGTVWGLQRQYYEGRSILTEFCYDDGEVYVPDYAKMAEGFRIKSFRVERPEEIRPALEAALAYDGPTLVDVVVDRTFSSTPPTVSRCGWDRYYPDWKAE